MRNLNLKNPLKYKIRISLPLNCKKFLVEYSQYHKKKNILSIIFWIFKNILNGDLPKLQCVYLCLLLFLFLKNLKNILILKKIYILLFPIHNYTIACKIIISKLQLCFL